MTEKKQRIKITKFDFSYKGITAGALLETIYKKQNGLYPVTIRVTFNRIRKRYRTGIDLTSDQWNVIEITKDKKLIEIRESVQSEIDKIKREVKDLADNKGFTFDAFHKRVSSGRTDNLLDAFDSKVKKLTKAGRIGTAEYYSSASKMIKNFSYPGLNISDITPEWLQRFEAWMIEKGKSYTTVGMYMRAIRAILNDADMNSSQYPFGEGKYQIPESAGRKAALTLDQVEKIAAAPLKTDPERRYRDMWYFMFLCSGINVNDLIKLRYSDISGDEISWRRKKTARSKRDKSKTVTVYLPQMQQIVARWGNPSRKPDDFIFPALPKRFTPVDEKRIVKNVTKLINKYMGIIGKSLGFGKISTNISRHSFATISRDAGVPLAYISEQLSHSDLKTTAFYLDSFKADQRKEYAQKLIQHKDDRRRKKNR